MDISILAPKQSQQVKPESLEGAAEAEKESGVGGRFSKALTEAVEKDKTAEEEAVNGEKIAMFRKAAQTTGNELPFSEETLASELIDSNLVPDKAGEGELFSAAEGSLLYIGNDTEEEIGGALSAFLSGLPAGLKGDSKNQALSSPVESTTLFKTAKEDFQRVERSMTDLFALKETKVITERLAFPSLKGGEHLASVKEPLPGTFTPLTQALEQTVLAKEQLPAMSKPLGHPEWGRELGERISWMAGKTIQSAELRLNPAKLGPIDVRIQITQDQTSVTFSSPHAAVREALEQAMPRLREMMTAQQFERVDIDISNQSFEERQQQADQGELHDLGGSRELSNVDDEELSERSAISQVIVGKGLLNYYV